MTHASLSDMISDFGVMLLSGHAKFLRADPEKWSVPAASVGLIHQ